MINYIQLSLLEIVTESVCNTNSFVYFIVYLLGLLITLGSLGEGMRLVWTRFNNSFAMIICDYQ